MGTENPTTPTTSEPAITTSATTATPSAANEKLVPEKDLIAVKKAKEGLEIKLKETEDTFKSRVAEVENKLISAEAKAQELEDKLKTASMTAEETAKTKALLEAANRKVSELEIRALDARKKSIAATYRIPVDTMKDKTMEQIDLYEEALKSIAPNGLAGSGFAVGAGGAGVTKPETPLDRAKRTLQEYDERKQNVRLKGNAIPAK